MDKDKVPREQGVSGIVSYDYSSENNSSKDSK